MKKFFLLLVLLLPAISIFAQNDFKLRERMTMAGRTMESAVMIKGARERTERDQMGMKTVEIMQCDLKRYIKINDVEKKYYIEPMATETAVTQAAPLLALHEPHARSRIQPPRQVVHDRHPRARP